MSLDATCHLKKGIVVLLGLLVVGLWTASPAAQGTGATVQIDGAVQYQTMMGFGATLIPFDLDGVYRAHDPRQPERVFVPRETREAIARLIHTELGITRARLFPDGFEPENDNDDPYTFDWNRFRWDFRSYRLPGADIYADYVALCRPYGLQVWFPSFSIYYNAPGEAWLRLPGSSYALNPDLLDEFVEWLLAVAVHFAYDLDLELPYLIIQNEPSFGGGGGRVIQIPDMVTIVRQLGERMAKMGLGTRIVIPDDLNLNNALAYIEAVLADPEAAQYVGALAYHNYDGLYDNLTRILHTSARGQVPADAISARARLRALADRYGIPVWMTEISAFIPHDMTAFEVALARANHIHDELTVANASAFDQMNLFFLDRPRIEEELVSVYFRPDGTLERYRATEVGYIMGQYARYVVSDSVRIMATSSDPYLRVSAFMRPDGGTTFVAINNNTAARQVTLRFENLKPPPSRFSIRQSTATQLWATPPAVDVTGDRALITLPAQSVTTLSSEY